MTLVALALAVLPSGGVVETGATPSQSLKLDGVSGELLELLSWYETDETRAGTPFEWRRESTFECPRYTRYDLTFPSPVHSSVEENDTVHARYWQPTGPQPGPAAVVLHWKGGAVDLVDLICGRLAQDGVAALMLYLPHYGPRRSSDPAKRTRMLSDDYESVLANYRQAVLDVRRAVDWMSARPEVDAERVGLVGISLGAVVGSLAAGVDPRFSRCVLLLGGGDVAGIVMNESRETRSVRRAVQRAGLDVDELRALWRPAEPLTFASRIRADGVLMINADADQVIPRSCTEKLQRAIGVREVRWYAGGHHAIAPKAFEILRLAVDFLRKVPAAH